MPEDTLRVFLQAETGSRLPVEAGLDGFVDVVVDDIEPVPTLLAHVGDHITGLWRLVRWESGEQVGLASTLHANDGVGDRLLLDAALLPLPDHRAG